MRLPWIQSARQLRMRNFTVYVAWHLQCDDNSTVILRRARIYPRRKEHVGVASLAWWSDSDSTKIQAGARSAESNMTCQIAILYHRLSLNRGVVPRGTNSLELSEPEESPRQLYLTQVEVRISRPRVLSHSGWIVGGRQRFRCGFKASMKTMSVNNDGCRGVCIKSTSDVKFNQML